MTTRHNVLVACAVVTSCVALFVYLSWWSSGSPQLAPPDVLAEQALQGTSVDEQERAAVGLATQASESRQLLRQVFRESNAPPVRAACISGLARDWDYESMDDLLAALDDESPLVRGRAGAAVQKMIGGDFFYRAEAPPQERAEAAQRMREAWVQMRSSGKVEDWNRRRNAMN